LAGVSLIAFGNIPLWLNKVILGERKWVIERKVGEIERTWVEKEREFLIWFHHKSRWNLVNGRFG
jgi:hypothetical protein